MTPRFLGHAVAITLYYLCAWSVAQHGVRLGMMVPGAGADPFIYIWFLAWWPHALAHHLDPLFTDLVWQPSGLNLAWTTSIPTLALLAMPLTLTLGPVLTYNLLCLAAPVSSALGAYALCLYVTRQRIGAWFGGFLFAFSSYAMARQNDQLNLSFTVLLPLLLLLALARMDGRIGRKTAVGAGSLMLVAQAGLSLEIFATGVLAGCFAWVTAWCFLPVRRKRLFILLQDALLVGAAVLVLLAPLLWAMFAGRRDMHLPEAWPDFFSTDLLNFFVPTTTTALGGQLFGPVSSHFSGLVCEQGGYLGLPLIGILWAYLRRGRSYLCWLFVGLVLAALGPHLWLGGRETGLPMPWAVFRAIPLLGNALPARLMLYPSLIAAVFASSWLAEARTVFNWRLAGMVLAVLFLWPAPRPMQSVPELPLFTPQRVAQVFGPDRKLLFLPFGFNGHATYWQVESNFGFALTGGYLGFPPVQVQRMEPIMRLYLGLETPNLLKSLVAYCQDTRTDFVVAAPGTPVALVAGLQGLKWPRKQVDDVTIFTVPDSQ